MIEMEYIGEHQPKEKVFVDEDKAIQLLKTGNYKYVKIGDSRIEEVSEKPKRNKSAKVETGE
jgi:hypothetical protein